MRTSLEFRPTTSFEQAIQALATGRRERMRALAEPPRELVEELGDLEVELQALRGSPEREAADGAWRELVKAFGSAEETWAQYPSAAGLVRLLRTPLVRDSVVRIACMGLDGAAH